MKIFNIVIGQILKEQKVESSSAQDKTKMNPKLWISFTYSKYHNNIIQTFIISNLIGCSLHKNQIFVFRQQNNQRICMYFQLGDSCNVNTSINRITKFQAEHDRLKHVDISGQKVELQIVIHQPIWQEPNKFQQIQSYQLEKHIQLIIIISYQINYLMKLTQMIQQYFENQKLRDGQNYIIWYRKEELEQQEDIVNFKKVL
ncbi:unnamed protein product [Paramecium sonneborni]|uniref:Uncharacterized protein n=1 Tax=Paramecium sonneborni TaxID=65129 RepID=A0A8S1Q4A9_9CILI|nr:unnamed protein product [Paramecium sonneborni]